TMDKKESLRPGLLLLILLLLILPLGPAEAQGTASYDLVIVNGKVIDPESGLDAVRNIGIDDGKVVALSKDELNGKKQIDATNLVVAPGFIDIHSHAINVPSMWMQAFDGVSTTLELERGAWPVGKTYE